MFIGPCMREITNTNFSALCLPRIFLKFILFDILTTNYHTRDVHVINYYGATTI